MIPYHVNYDVYMCLCSHVYVSACVQRPEVGVWWLPPLLPILLLRCLSEFLTEIGAQQLAKVVGYLAPRINLSLSLSQS